LSEDLLSYQLLIPSFGEELKNEEIVRNYSSPNDEKDESEQSQIRMYELDEQVPKSEPENSRF
jgi:hypothetical protein